MGFGDVDFSPDVIDKAAVLCVRLALARNRIERAPPSVEERVAVIEGVAAGKVTERELADWLRASQRSSVTRTFPGGRRKLALPHRLGSGRRSGRMNAVEALTLARREQLHRRGVRLEWSTVSWNVLEAAVAIAAGLAAGSVALIGFGVDSGIEVLAAAALLWRFRQAGVDAGDEERGEAERKALYVVAGTFFLLAVYIAVEGVSALASHEEPGTSRLGLGLAIASLVVMPALAWAKQQTGRRLGSLALQADAVETWVCAYLSFALLAGMGLNLAFGWWWADPLCALAMLPVTLWQGWETLAEAREPTAAD